MLQLIRSNAIEVLLAELARRLGESPPASPFAPELVVAPSPAMARWINLQLARVHGVAANYQYPLPASFVWDLARRSLEDLPETDPLARDAIAWKVFSLLPELLAGPAFEPLRHYLRDDQEGLKRWQLAGRIADVLDRYQLYRPELIRRWSAGQGEDWQALLWRRLTVDLAGRHRVAVIDRLLGALERAQATSALPEPVRLFALSSLPPLFVEVIHALARRLQVELYLHAPTDAFWADLVSQKRLAQERLRAPERSDLWEVGNALLASWGRQGQALQDLLLAQETPIEEHDAFREPSAEQILQRLQGDIFRLRPPATEGERIPIAADDSLEVHICHSPLRECQVLHDRLLAMLEADPELRPEDILVMIPEISLYAPYVEGVFAREGEGGRPFIPWNLSDIAVKDEHPLVLSVLQLLALPDSRFSHSEVLAYLDVPELAAHFGLDGEAVAQVKAWLAEARLRWGLDAQHKERLGLPGVAENTFAQAEGRLFGGYALAEAAAFAGIAPIGGVEGTRAEGLGRFWRLLDRLAQAAERLAVPRTAAAWQTELRTLLTAFFGERDDADGRLQRIRDALADLAEEASAVDEPLSSRLVRRWLTQRLGAEGHRGRYFSGGVSFCGMRPLRSVPFRVICVLGLHDQAFPRRDRRPDFDRMRQGWRPGDPHKGDEDRYLFLETLLCARRRLYLSYVGRDLRRNTERQPSVLLRELMDYIDQHYGLAGGGEGERLSARLTRVHPLQPFSPRNYTGGAASYDALWCQVARTLAAPATGGARPDPGWPSARLPPAPERMREVGLAELERFLRHPVRYFVQTRLGLYLREEPVAEDEEPFDPEPLQRFGLRERLIADELAGREVSAERLRAEGLLPHGPFAQIGLASELKGLAPLLAQLAPYRGQRAELVRLDLQLHAQEGPRRLSGQVSGIYPGLGLLRWRAGRIRGGDVLALWLAHLAWCASGDPRASASRLVADGEGFTLREPLSADLARAELARYLDWYWEGVHRPLLVLPKASYAYARGLSRDGEAEPSQAAYSAWEGNGYQKIRGDRDDLYVQLIRRGLEADPLAHPELARLAAALYERPLSKGQWS